MSFFHGFSKTPKSVQVPVQSDVQVAEGALVKVRLSRDVCPLADFRANVASWIQRVRASGDLIIITQHGRSSAVLLGIEAYERLLDEIELLREVREAEGEASQAQLVEQQRVENRLRTILGR
jgi:prevent-host-death family protein